jgi:hypothetical protein
MTLNPAELTHLAAGLPRFGIFLHLACTPAVRLWLGVGNIEPGTNAVDLTGDTYRGMGEVGDLPSFSHLFEGAADRVEFTLSGIEPSALADIAPELAGQQDAIQGKEVHVGWAGMDYSWALLGSIHWEWYGFADLIRLRHGAPGSADAPSVCSLTLSAGDWLTGRRCPGLSFMVDHDQKRRASALNPSSNPDRFCERVGLYNQGIEKRWPVV